MSAAFAAAAAAAATAATAASRHNNRNNNSISPLEIGNTSFHHHQERPVVGRYESMKRRDWNNFRHYIQIRSPSIVLSSCTGAEVIEFLCYLDQFENTKAHNEDCPIIIGGGTHPTPGSPCRCPLRQTEWASLNGIIGRLVVAYEENVRSAGENPFRVPAVKIYLQEVKESQAKGNAQGRKKSQEVMGRHTP